MCLILENGGEINGGVMDYESAYNTQSVISLNAGKYWSSCETELKYMLTDQVFK